MQELQSDGGKKNLGFIAWQPPKLQEFVAPYLRKAIEIGHVFI